MPPKHAPKDGKPDNGGRGGRGGGRGRGGNNNNRGGGGNNASRKDNNNAKAEQAPAADPLPAKAAPAEPVRPPPLQVAPYNVGSLPEIEEGVRRGTHIIAALKVPKKWTFKLAFATSPGFMPRDIALHGMEARGDALPGDIVAIELDPMVKWNAVDKKSGSDAPHVPVGYRSKKEGGDPVFLDEDGEQEVSRAVIHSDDCEATIPSQRILQALQAKPQPDWATCNLQPQGKVVAVLERRHERHVACRYFGDVPEGGVKVQRNRFYKFKPYTEAMPLICVYGRDIPTNFWEETNAYLFLIETTLDPAGNLSRVNDFPQGRVVLSLGKSGTAEAESKAIAATHNTRDFDFPEEVEACVAKEFTMPSAAELEKMGRRDLREEEFICTIDPATARDLDDALSIVKTPGGYKVGVHIADVSHFVPLDTPLDEEARERCTSTYFVERVVPMLPRRLCEDYCSLNAGSDKFAFSAIFHFDNTGKQTSEWFGQSVIRNRCRMAYGDAQKIIDGDLSGDSLVFDESETEIRHREELVAKVINSVQLLFELAGKLRDARFDRGALSLNKRKMRFLFEDMNSTLAPKGFVLDKTKEANWVIEEFMLLANIRVATKIVQFLPDGAMLRRHEPPNRQKLQQFNKAAKAAGFDVSTSGSKALNNSLAQYADHPLNDALRLTATYCMSLAKYCSSGEDESQTVSHYALATPLYTHFTSPIRRYADLIVHRQLLLALDVEKEVKRNKNNGNADAKVDPATLPHSRYYIHPLEVESIAENANERKEGARKAGEASAKMFFCLYLEALRLRSTVDSRVSPTQRCTAIVSKIGADKFTLYAPQIATDVELFHNAMTQRWVTENTVNEDGTFDINWGVGPDGKEAVEKCNLFTEVEVTLKVTFRGNISLDFIIHPPWERTGDAAILDMVPEEL